MFMGKSKIIWVERNHSYIEFFLEFNNLKNSVECKYFYNSNDAISELSIHNDADLEMMTISLKNAKFLKSMNQ